MATNGTVYLTCLNEASYWSDFVYCVNLRCKKYHDLCNLDYSQDEFS